MVTGLTLKAWGVGAFVRRVLHVCTSPRHIAAPSGWSRSSVVGPQPYAALGAMRRCCRFRSSARIVPNSIAFEYAAGRRAEYPEKNSLGAREI